MKSTLINLTMLVLRGALFADLLWIGWNIACKLVLSAPFNWWCLLPIPLLVFAYIFMIMRFIEEFTGELEETTDQDRLY